MKENPTSLKRVLFPDAPIRPDSRLTAIMIDGNSIGAMAASRQPDGRMRVEAVRHVELDRLVELTRRLRHPIFMDVSYSFFPERELIADRLRDIFALPEFQNPTITLLAPEKVRHAESPGRPTQAGRRERLEKLLSDHLPFNPYDYPALLTCQDVQMDSHHDLTRITVARLADLLPLPQVVRSAGGLYAGIVPATTAASHVVRWLAPKEQTEPLLLCDVGKLRTLYTTLLPDGTVHHYPIPVGLARDDMHYFKSIAPSTDKLVAMQHTLGRLFFPPEVTPSPLFSGYASSPQIDCTRFAIQITRYAQRSIEATLRDVRGAWPGSHYISGRSSRLPGLRDYIEARLHGKVRRIDRRPLRGVELAEGLTWAEVADNLLLLGALREALDPDPSRGAPLLSGELTMPPLQGSACTIAKLRTDMLYVFEQKIDIS